MSSLLDHVLMALLGTNRELRYSVLDLAGSPVRVMAARILKCMGMADCELILCLFRSITSEVVVKVRLGAQELDAHVRTAHDTRAVDRVVGRCNGGKKCLVSLICALQGCSCSDRHIPQPSLSLA